MAFPGTNSGSAAYPASTWAFNPPPGWPAPPPGWQPPEGWQPEPSWPPAPTGWNFWVPAAAPAYGYASPSQASHPAAAHPAAARRVHDPDALKTVLGTLFPVRSWLHDRGWRQWTRLIIIPYALLPLIFLNVFIDSSSPSTPGWAYALYIAPLWAAGFWLLIRPGRLGRRELWIGLGVIIWTVIWEVLIAATINTLVAPGHGISAIAAVIIGLNEELTKALPVLVIGLILKRQGKMLDVRMWMFMGALAGLAFGVIEQASYVTSDAAIAFQGLRQGASAGQADVFLLLNFTERVFVDGLQHAIWAGIAGFFMGIAINYRKRRLGIIALGIGVPALLHALNDFVLGGPLFGPTAGEWVWVIIQAASVILFLSYTLSAHSIEERVRESPVFRGQSMVLDVSALRAQAGPGPAPETRAPGTAEPRSPHGQPGQQAPPPGWTQT